MSDEATAVLQAYLDRIGSGDARARELLLAHTRDRLLRIARRHLHGRHARLGAFEQTDDVIQQLYVKILENEDRFWTNAQGEPVRTLAEYFGHASAWLRDVLCDLLRRSCGRHGDRPAAVPLDGGATGGLCHDPVSDTADGAKVRRWTEFHEVAGRLPDDLRAVFDLLWYQELSQAEAAALLGIAVPTVKVRWMKARLRVQQALGDSPFEDRDG